MNTKVEDEGIKAVRDIRIKIVEHYIVEQQRYESRLLRLVVVKKSDFSDSTSVRC